MPIEFNFSEFTRANEDARTAKPRTVTLTDVAARIKSKHYENKVAFARAERAHDVAADEWSKEGKLKTPRYDTAKLALLVVAFAGVFSQRGNAYCVESSGLMVLDFDHLAEQGLTLAEVRAAINADPHTIMSFVSPSNDGMKGIVEKPKTLDNEAHKAHWQWIAEYYHHVLQYDLDGSGKNIERLCFLSSDPDLYLAESWQAFNIPVASTDSVVAPAPSVRDPRFVALDAALTPEQVFADIGWRPQDMGSLLGGECPRHGSSSGTPLRVWKNRAQGFYCFHGDAAGDCGAHGRDLIDLIALFKGVSVYDAARYAAAKWQPDMMQAFAPAGTPPAPIAEKRINKAQAEWSRGDAKNALKEAKAALKTAKKVGDETQIAARQAAVDAAQAIFDAAEQTWRAAKIEHEQQRGEKRNSAQVVESILLKHRIEYDEIKECVRVDGEELSEDAELMLWTEVQRSFTCTQQLFGGVLLTLAKQNVKNRVTEFVVATAKRAEGKTIKEFVAYAFPGASLYADVHLRKWMIGVLARATNGSQNRMIVMLADEGDGKGFFFRWLMSPFRGYLCFDTLEPHKATAARHAARNIAWLVEEFQPLVRTPVARAHLKSFLTADFLNFDDKFARSRQRLQRASFMAHGNDDHGGFFNDPGERERRFAVIETPKIMRDYPSKFDVIDLWREAAVAYQAGENPLDLTPEVEAARRDLIKHHKEDDPLENYLRCNFDAADTPFPNPELLDRLADRGLLEKDTRGAMLMAHALRKCGFKKADTRKSGVRGYLIKPKQNAEEIE
jgi:hypothetical protein